MHNSVWRFLPSLLLAAFVASPLWAGNNSKLTDPQIAAKLGIRVQQVHSLRNAFSFSNDELLNLSTGQLSDLLRDLDHPGIEKHRDEEEFRVLRMMDEHGKIP